MGACVGADIYSRFGGKFLQSARTLLGCKRLASSNIVLQTALR